MCYVKPTKRYFIPIIVVVILQVIKVKTALSIFSLLRQSDSKHYKPNT